jgi:hypothetical protein
MSNWLAISLFVFGAGLFSAPARADCNFNPNGQKNLGRVGCMINSSGQWVPYGHPSLYSGAPAPAADTRDYAADYRRRLIESQAAERARQQAECERGATHPVCAEVKVAAWKLALERHRAYCEATGNLQKDECVDVRTARENEAQRRVWEQTRRARMTPEQRKLDDLVGPDSHY